MTTTRRTGALAAPLLLVAAGFIVPAHAAPGDIIASFPAPDGASYGITWDGTDLWVAGNAAHAIYRLTTAGAVVGSFPVPNGSQLAGLTFDGTDLWVADDATDSIHRYSTAGALVSSIPAPGNAPNGLTWDGANLWHADKTGADPRIYELTTAGAVVSSFPTPGGQTRGLGWDGTYLWNVDKETDLVYQLTTTGVVVSSFPIPCINARGITFDGTNFWVSCEAGSIFQVEGPPVFSGQRSIVKRAFLADGSPVSHLSTLPRGTRVKFLLYVDNPGPAVSDVSLRDVLDPSFLYVSGSMRFDNSIPNCATGNCSPGEEATIFAAVDAGTPGTDAVDGDPVSFSGSAVDGGDQTVPNAPLDIGATSVWAMLFEVKMQ